jgi:N-methylhydantoinase A
MNGTGPEHKNQRPVWFPEAGGFVDTPVFDRYALTPGAVIDGPAIFEENESTLVIGPGGRATVLIDGVIDVVVP